eukprot:1161479-Pelagomonas_calceolata.AAC.8
MPAAALQVRPKDHRPDATRQGPVGMTPAAMKGPDAHGALKGGPQLPNGHNLQAMALNAASQAVPPTPQQPSMPEKVPRLTACRFVQSKAGDAVIANSDDYCRVITPECHMLLEQTKVAGSSLVSKTMAAGSARCTHVPLDTIAAASCL